MRHFQLSVNTTHHTASLFSSVALGSGLVKRGASRHFPACFLTADSIRFEFTVTAGPTCPRNLFKSGSFRTSARAVFERGRQQIQNCCTPTCRIVLCYIIAVVSAVLFPRRAATSFSTSAGFAGNTTVPTRVRPVDALCLIADPLQLPGYFHRFSCVQQFGDNLPNDTNCILATLCTMLPSARGEKKSSNDTAASSNRSQTKYI